MKKYKRRDLIKTAITSTGALALLNGCSVIEAGASIGMQAVGLSSAQADSIIRSGKAVARTFKDFTSEQEYYIGRTVAANVIERYPIYNHQQQTMYLNLVGHSLVHVSDIPETFGGYHFAILNSTEVNAFAAPGGLIFVTRGMLQCCPNEDALAAVLAHEISHVQLKHGLQAIKDSRVTDAVTILASEAAGNLAGENLKSLVKTFEGSIADITSTMVHNGYSRVYEKEADQLAVDFLQRAGYSPKGMDDMLKLMKVKIKPGGIDFFKTHPSPQSRLSLLETSLASPTPIKPSRSLRFKQQMSQV